ncbi:MAG: hypothetical protein M3394_08920, partial [Actinomycetota bacterium]|nr:hypothetical protein [Actinomycetota bacterium]
MAVAVLGAVPGIGRTAAQAAAPAQDREFEEIGTLSRVPDDAVAIFGEGIVPNSWNSSDSQTIAHDGSRAHVGTLIPVPEARQLWQLFKVDTPTIHTKVAVRDMDTLRIVGTLVVDGYPMRMGTTGSEWVTATDGGRRLFWISEAPKDFVSIDTRTFAIRRYPIPNQFSLVPWGGIAYDARADRLLLSASVLWAAMAASVTTFLMTLDLETGEMQSRVVRACTGPLPSTAGGDYQTAPFAGDDGYVYVPCHRAGNSGAVVRIEHGAVLDADSSEETAVGPTNLSTAIPDRKGRRIIMATQKGDIWVFDTSSMAYVGVVGAQADHSPASSTGYGVDPETGRVFFLSSTHGLGVVEARFFPVPQARTRLDLASRSQEAIVSDARNNRIFVLPGPFSNRAKEYVIYRTRPAPTPPSPPDPDRNTSDQPEAAGLTESRYNAGASGYGARVLLANGVSTVAPAPGVGALMPTADFLRNTFNAKCGFTDRELVAGRVTRTEADTGSTVAESAAVVIDSRTRLDLDRPSRCEPYGKDGSSDRLEPIFATAPEPYDNNDERNPRWNRDPAVCSTSEGDAPKQSDGDDHGAPPLGSARADCPTPGKGDVAASARTALAGAVSVGRAEAKTLISRGAGRVRSRSEAIAADVAIGDGIRIGEIRSAAVSESDGRPRKDPMSTHTVVIRDLTIAGVDVCGVCDPTQALDALNRAVSGRAEFRFGTTAADGRLVKGSPKGALTAVQKSAERQVSDRSLVGDFTVEIPALELIAYNDNGTWGRGRQLFQFAGVATSATYN